ncbi:hypothetical protein AB1K54_10120 [Microbacterium sp. BWT-B31]|uniref:hypothetical protein n=1 Tax=Microbacterium sp. BWT-B31 TaxID=3232072 RepID=UPI003529D209
MTVDSSDLLAVVGATAVSPARAPKTDAPPRRLRLLDALPRRRRRPTLVYGIVALAGALVIGSAQMAVSILTTQSSYELSELAQQQRELAWKKQILDDDLAGLSSPQFLAANASALGLVIEEAPSYLRLSDGALLGTGQAAIGSSSIDALGRAAVPNALVADTPLVTDPKATIEGVPDVPVTVTGGDGVVDSPPPITDGLPTPETH